MSSRKDFENDSPVVSQDSSKIDNLRIFFCGAHSVGKTTLAKEIVKDTDIHIQTEIARKIIREMGMKREDFEPKSQPTRFLELQRRIIRAQAGEERHKDEQGLSYVSDRGLDPVVYASVYLGKQEADDLLQLAETKEIVQRYTLFVKFT
jgi:nicotinamide riboside kinase